jgi:hypothetical protein
MKNWLPGEIGTFFYKAAQLFSLKVIAQKRLFLTNEETIFKDVFSFCSLKNYVFRFWLYLSLLFCLFICLTCYKVFNTIVKMFRNYNLKVKITFKKLGEKNQWGSPADLVSVIVQESPQAALVALHHQKQAHVPSVAGRVESGIVEKILN